MVDRSGGGERRDLVISGASFAGLTLALALARALGPDMRIAVLDRRPPLAVAKGEEARALALSAGSRRMLDVLGVWGRAAGEAQAVQVIDITDSSLEAGARRVMLSYDNRLEGGENASYIVPDSALTRALHAAVREQPAIDLIAPAETSGLDLADPLAGVHLADGRTLRAPLIVAAEGRRSLLREAAGIKVVGWGYGQSGIVVTVAHERPHDGRAVQHFLPSGPFAILPLPGNRCCITWSEGAEEAKRIMALDDAGFLAEVGRRFGERLGALTLAGPRKSWPLEMHLARGYVAHRLALIGDTAHGVHPIAGQGLNLALRDVAALAEIVTDNARLGLDIGNADALARYERWRRFDAAMSAAAFDGLNRLFSNDWTLLRLVRDAGLGLVDRLPFVKRMLVEEAAGLSGEVPRLLKGESL